MKLPRKFLTHLTALLYSLILTSLIIINTAVASNLSIAFDNLGFQNIEIYGDFDYNTGKQPKIIKIITKKEQQIAAINELYLAGYLNKQYIWRTVHVLGGFKDTPEKVFQKLVKVLEKSGAYKNKLNEKYIIDHLFEDINFDVQDAEDFIVYLMQTAFDRPDRKKDYIHLFNKEWMIKNKHQIDKNASNLGMIDTMYPSRRKYDETWVLGARKNFIEQRLHLLRSFIYKGIDPGKIILLTGDRELQTSLDDKEYMVKLAYKYSVKLNDHQPFTKDGKYNYDISEQVRLHEIDMVLDLLESEEFKEIFGNSAKHEIYVVPTQSQDGFRVTTENTALNAFKELQKRSECGDLIGKEEININIITNQVFNLRQYNTIINTLQKFKKYDQSKFKFFVSGDALIDEDFKLYDSVVYGVIHSQIGALFFDKYEIMRYKNPLPRKRSIEQIKYQTRNKLEEKLDIPSYEQYLKKN